MVMIAQLCGAAGRIGAGQWSDIVGSRLHPVRTIAGVAAVSMGLWALADLLDSPLAVAVMVIASTVTVSDNSLAFTAIAEIAGRSGAGARSACRTRVSC
jgi:hypothetical protein